MIRQCLKLDLSNLRISFYKRVLNFGTKKDKRIIDEKKKSKPFSIEQKFLQEKNLRYKQVNYIQKQDEGKQKKKEKIVESNQIKTEKIQSLDFEDLTQNLKESLQEDENFKKEFDVLRRKSSDTVQQIDKFYSFPWDFKNIQKEKQGEQNLKCLIDPTRIISNSQVIGLFKQLIEDIQQMNYQSLEGYCERAFYRRLVQQLKPLEKQQMKIQVKNLRSKNNLVDLFEVKNIFGVGVNTNRRKNSFEGDYIVREEFQHEQKIPVTIIQKKKLESHEISNIILQFYLQIETDISLSVIDSEGKIIFADQIEDGKNKKQWHQIILETVLVSCDYKDLQLNFISRNKELDEKLLSQYSNNLSNLKIQIIDIDNFLNQNQIIRKLYDPVL